MIVAEGTLRQLKYGNLNSGRSLGLGVGPYFAVKGLNFFRYFAGKGAKFRRNFAGNFAPFPGTNEISMTLNEISKFCRNFDEIFVVLWW